MNNKVTIGTITTKAINKVKGVIGYLNDRPYFTALSAAIIAIELTIIYLVPHNKYRTLLESLSHMASNHKEAGFTFIVVAVALIFIASKFKTNNQ
jgi:hypothetical protein